MLEMRALFSPGIDHPEAGGSLFVTFQGSGSTLKQISAQIVFNLKRWVQIAAELPEPHGGLCFHYHPDIIRSLSKLYFALNYFPTLVHHFG